jgi:polyferredoxin
MSKRRHLKILMKREQIARTTRRWMIVLITFFAITALVFIFKVGGEQWTPWMVKMRTSIIGILLFIVVVLSVAAPVIIEVNSNTRPLSGPGNNPYLPEDNSFDRGKK